MKSLKWLLISSLAVSYVMVGSGSKTIHAEHNNIEFIQIKEGETIPLYKFYSGGELCAQGLTALKNFGNRNASKVYFNTNKSTYVYSYITKDGQQCTRTPSGTQYVCAYSG